MERVCTMTIATRDATKEQVQHFVAVTAQWIGEEAAKADVAYHAGDTDQVKACLEAILYHARELGYSPAAPTEARDDF